MALPVFPADEAAFLDGLNSEPFDPSTNPKGLDDGGHITLFPEAMTSIADLANYFAALGVALQTLADQTAEDAASAAAGSGTEATVPNVRAGLSAFYLSIRRVYEANAPVVLADAGNIAWDMSQGINFKLTLGAAGRALANPTNQVAGKSGLLIVSQDATGGRSITAYGNNLIWIGGEPGWPTTPNAKTVISYFVEANGTVLLSAGGSSA